MRLSGAREEAGAALDHIDHDPGDVSEFAGDKLYDDAATLAALQDLGVTCYVPEPAKPTGGKLSKKHFTYDPVRDIYIWPAGRTLKWSRHHNQRRASFYTAKVSDCRNCPHKSACTTAARRTISEHLNLLGKRDHALSRARGLGLAAMRIQVALVGVAINLKKLVRHTCLPSSDAFSCTAAASALLACALRACFVLWSALSGASRGSPADSSAVAITRTILPGGTTHPQPVTNRGI